MRERIRPTRSGLFAIELVVAVGVFTLCAAICTGIFAQSEAMSQDSADLTRAVNEARNAAERFKASNGDLARMAERFGGDFADGALSYGADGATYELRLMPGAETPDDVPPDAETPGYVAARLRAFREDGETMLDWEIAALEAEP